MPTDNSSQALVAFLLAFQSRTCFAVQSQLMIGLALAVVIGTGTVHAYEPSAPVEGYAHVLHRLAPGMHVLAQREPFHVQPLGNVALIEQSDGFVVVDTGGTPAAGRRVVEAVRSLGPAPVKAIVLTHWHGDHVLGAAAILREWPEARVIATLPTWQAAQSGLGTYRDLPKLQAALDRARDAYQAKAADPSIAAAERDRFAHAAREVSLYAGQFDDDGLVEPTELVSDRLELTDSHNPVSVVHMGPANTPGDLIVLLPRQKIAVVGDMLVAPVPFAFDVEPAPWAAALRRIIEWGPQWIVPGHGAPMQDTTYASRIADWLCVAQRRANVLLDHGGNDGGAARINLDDQVLVIAGADPWLRRWARDYWVTPLAESALKHAAAGDALCPSAGLPHAL